MTSSSPQRNLAGRRLMVATPMYEGMCHAHYARGLAELALACREAGVALTLKIITNQACLARARAYMAGSFLRTDADHLMMIDADMGFAAADVLSLLALQVEQPDHAVIGAAASRKAIDWDRVARASRSGAEVSLAKVAGTMTVNFAADAAVMRIDRPHEARDLGAAFMLVARGVFETLAERHPELSYASAAWERENFGVGERVTAYFESMIDREADTYLNDDYAFCRRVQAAGMKVWLAPWIELTHIGNMAFEGSFRELARLEAHSKQ